MKVLVQLGKVAYGPAVWPGTHDAVKPGIPETVAHGNELERTIVLRFGPKNDGGASPANGKSHSHARPAILGRNGGGVESRVNDGVVAQQRASPARIDALAGGFVNELDDFIAHASRQLQRRQRKNELIHATADQSYQSPQQRTGQRANLAPGVQIVGRCALVEVADARIDPGTVKAVAAQIVEAGEQAGGGRGALFQILGCGNVVVHLRTHRCCRAYRTSQPGTVFGIQASTQDAYPCVNGSLGGRSQNVVEAHWSQLLIAEQRSRLQGNFSALRLAAWFGPLNLAPKPFQKLLRS